MTETTLTEQDRATLRKLFTLFHERAREKGFHAMSDKVHEYVVRLRSEDPKFAAYLLSVHQGNRAALIGDEVTETREEVRKGKLTDELYTSETHETKVAKPEGYLTEMADIFIRFGDTIGEEDYYTDKDFIGLFLDVLEGKLGFNKQRSHMNGGKKF